MSAPKEGTKVLTAQGEPATVYMVLPDGEHCVLQMDDQFMPDGGVAFRTVPVESVTRRPA
jgi:hypothetical protein